MSQFKRFNSSDNTNWNTGDAYPAGTLTWDMDNGLRLHDGNTSGGNTIGGGSSNFYDLTNRPTGNTAVHDLQGGSSSVLNGNFLKQTSIGVSEWVALPTTYDTLTINTKVEGGLVGAAGTQITGIEGTLGSGQPWQYAFISTNSAFSTFYDQGSSIIGWKMYPASNPSAFVTVTEYLNGNQLGAPGLGFDGSLGQGPWVAESPDYTAGTPGPLTLSAGTKEFVFGTDGVLTLPAAGAAEGGEIHLARAPQSTLAGDVSIDIYDNKIRFFENGGYYRGFYLDLSTGSNGIDTNIMSGGGSSFSGSYDDLTDKPTIPTDVNQLADSSSLLPAAQVRYEMRSANFTAVAGKTYWLDSGTTAKTVTLPASPTVGDWVRIYDASNNWQTYNLTVDGNGNNVRTFNLPQGWNSPASTGTINQSLISPAGPFAVALIWDGTSWFSAI